MPLIAARFEEIGQLVRLLPDWKMAEVDVWLAMPDDKMPKRIRVFVDHLVAHFQKIA